MILPLRVFGSSGVSMIWRGLGDGADLVRHVVAQLLDQLLAGLAVGVVAPP